MTARTIQSPSLKKGMLQLGFISLLNLVFPILVLAFVSRQLGPAPLGAFYLYNGLLAWFLLLADFGVGLHASRELASLNHDSVAFATAFRGFKRLQILASFVAFLVFQGLVSLVPFFQANQKIGWIMGFSLLAIPLTHDWLYQGQGRFQNLVLRSAATKALTLIGILLLVRGPENLTEYAILMVLSAFAYTLPTLPEAWGLWKSAKPSGFARYWKPASLLLASALTVSLYIHLDSVWLAILTDPKTVGIYNAGLRVAKLAALVLTSGSLAVVVRLSSIQRVEEMGATTAILQKTLSFVFVIMIPIAGVMSLLAPDIIQFLYGSQFSDAIPVLRISSFQLIFIGISNYMGMQVLLHRRRQGWIFIATAIAAVFGLTTTWIWIPSFGAIGAASGSLVAEIVVAMVETILVAKLYPEIPLVPVKWPILCVGYGVGCGLAWSVDHFLSSLPIWIRLCAIPSITFAGIWAVFTFGKEPLTLSMLALARTWRLNRSNKTRS